MVLMNLINLISRTNPISLINLKNIINNTIRIIRMIILANLIKLKMQGQPNNFQNLRIRTNLVTLLKKRCMKNYSKNVSNGINYKPKRKV